MKKVMLNNSYGLEHKVILLIQSHLGQDYLQNTIVSGPEMNTENHRKTLSVKKLQHGNAMCNPNLIITFRISIDPSSV